MRHDYTGHSYIGHNCMGHGRLDFYAHPATSTEMLYSDDVLSSDMNAFVWMDSYPLHQVNRYGLYGYGLCSPGLCSYGLYRYGPYSSSR